MKHFLLLLFVPFTLSLQAQTPAKRVIGTSLKNWIGTDFWYHDSATYQYSAGRGHERLQAQTNYFISGYDEKLIYDCTADIIISEKEVLVYDGSNRVLSKTYLFYDQFAAAWFNNRRYLYTYDANNTRTETYQLYNTDWDNNTRNTIIYDANNNELSILYEDYTSSGWQKSMQLLYTYNAANKLLSNTRQDWSGNTWVNQYRYISTYDGNNNQLSETLESWISNLWLPSERTVMTYDGSNKKLSSTRQNMNSGNWTDFSRDLYTYDAANNLLMETGQVSIQGNWLNSHRFIYTYNAANKQLTYLNQDWENGNWLNTDLYSNTYNADNKVSSNTRDVWQAGTNSWNTVFREAFPYDADGYWLGKDTYNNINDSIQLTSEDRLFYETYTPTGLAEVAQITSSVYPNPATQNILLTFEAAQSGQALWSVSDLNGQILQSGDLYCQAGSNNIFIDLRNFATGIYMYHLTTSDGNSGHGKILKQ